MAKKTIGTGDGNGNGKGNDRKRTAEPHQHSSTPLTTNQGVPIADDQNMLRAGVRGPALLEDFQFLEKMTHFDHERIPERIVHARGSGAHGTFRCYKAAAKYSRAAFLQDPAVTTPVFVRFSTVAGGAGSVNLPRDVRGFATKFYTSEGNFNLVGNNIPVFFIQDALKFPDFVHAVKMEPDRGFPQNASAHDTFWDYISLAPEALHTVIWAMSDRAVPRSFRMMEGFGVNTFRMVDAKGRSIFIKWHWRPTLGLQSVTWDEAVKLCGADQDFHRRDLFNAIQAGAFPEWEAAIQPITEEQADRLDFDILDATKLIPEEVIPLVPIGTMVLDRWPENFFAETEQVAMHPGHLVPGIEFSDDPLLAGRIFSYTDTQLKRLGGPNFHELEINRPKCPFANFQRDGMARMQIDRGRTSFEPNSLEPAGPRETPHGFATHPAHVAGDKLRRRSDTFSDYHSQPRMFWRSQSPVEQRHIANAFTFELAKVDSIAIRKRVLGHLALIDADLGGRVADALGMTGQAEMIVPIIPPRDLPKSPAVGLLLKAKPALEGRMVGALISDGFDPPVIDKLRTAVTKAGAMFELVAQKRGATADATGTIVIADHMIAGGPSVIFDAVAIVTGKDVRTLVATPAAVQWVADAFTHCKILGVAGNPAPLLDAARVIIDKGVVDLAAKHGVPTFIELAARSRIWTREDLTPPPRPLPRTGGRASARTPTTTTKQRR